MSEDRGRIVAVIPPHQTLNDVTAALNGMGRVYPKNTLTLTNDNYDGSTVIVYNPNATAPTTQDSAEATTGKRRKRPAKTSQMTGEIALGKDDIADLFAYAFHPDTKSEDGVKAISVWMVHILNSVEGAANFVTFTLEHPDGQRYAMTIQRCDGLTPAEKLTAAEADNRILAAAGRMYLDAVDSDPKNEHLTLPEAIAVTDVREAVERHEPHLDATQEQQEPAA